MKAEGFKVYFTVAWICMFLTTVTNSSANYGPFRYIQFGIGMGKYLLALLLKLLCTQTLSQIPGCKHVTPQRSTDCVHRPKNPLNLAYPLQ